MACQHLSAARPVHRRTRGCEECEKLRQTWVRLRMCLSCGHVGCCDSSPGKHATAHFLTTQHPLMRSAEPGESWGWCYVDEVVLEPDTLDNAHAAQP